MAAELITPTDAWTGMPLSIAVPEDLSTLVDPGNVNWHHHFHRESAPELQGLGGKALRGCRAQLVPAELHNRGQNTYHAIFKGPPLPAAEDTSKQFLLCVLACAGYVPQYGIDVRSDNPEIPVRLTEGQMRLLQTRSTPREIKRKEVIKYMKKAGDDTTPRQAWKAVLLRSKRQAAFSYSYYRHVYEPLRDFFRDYLLQQEIDIDQKVMKRFLSSKDPVKQRALGETILYQTAAQSTARFREQYRRVYDLGLLHPLRPAKPERLVFTSLGSYAQRGLLVPELKRQLLDTID